VTTYGELHAGDIVVGYDGEAWGVERVAALRPQGERVVRPMTLIKSGERVAGLPAADEPVNVVHQEDTSAEAAAWGVFAYAGLVPEVLEETWEI